MISRDRSSWFDEEADLQVFVPGLMATGILVSIGMFVWDAVHKLLPDVGKRRQAARLAQRASGRVSDLNSIEWGEVPTAARILRVRRTRGAALLWSIAAFIAAGAAAVMTWGAYSARTGSLAGRGWTLSMGFSVTGAFAVFGIIWLCAALLSEQLPSWLDKAQARWPIGVLPEPTESDA